jgi:hypothetical protein
MVKNYGTVAKMRFKEMGPAGQYTLHVSGWNRERHFSCMN